MGASRAVCAALLAFSTAAVLANTDNDDDDLPFNRLFFAGTHNSAINLGAGTLMRPGAAVMGRFPSAAASAYQYEVMDQRLSVRDQLEQGIRLLDFEVAAIEGSFACNASSSSSSSSSSACADPPRCVRTHTLATNCFACCPFIVSHGSVAESANGVAPLGFTYPEDLLEGVADFARAHPREVLALLLIATHGNTAPSAAAVRARLNSTGLLERVWNADPAGDTATRPATPVVPTLGQMRAANRTVMLVYDQAGIWPSSPPFAGSHVNSSDVAAAGEVCAGGTPCMEGWDAVSFFQQDPARAVLGGGAAPPSGSLFAIENLSSRRGRADDSAKYWPLPNELADAPFQAGGNPAQAALAADYGHVVALEAAWAALLAPHGLLPGAVLVDFFNTTTPKPGKPSRTLLPNPEEGLIRAVRDINARRVQAWRAEQQLLALARG